MSPVTPTPPSPVASRRRFGAIALASTALVSAVLGGGAVHLLSHGDAAHAPTAVAPAGATPTDATPAPRQYTCPMHPSIVQDHSGKCPICGMDLVAVTTAPASPGDSSGSTVDGLSSVTIDPSRQQLIGLRTAPVTEGKVGGTWRTNGRVAQDETRVRRVNMKVPAFVERVYADFTGKAVRQGEPLFSVFSPELLAAQEEYLLALRTREALSQAGGMTTDGEALVHAALRKLQLWDVPQAALERLARAGEASRTLTLVSPISGVITRKDIVEGARLELGATPYEVVDLSRVWVLADVYENELRHVKVGMPATLQLKAFPNRVFAGKVAFLAPVLDPATRTVKVRLEFPNPDGDLRPEMFGEVVLRGTPREALKVPSDAVVPTGTTQVVFVALGDGRFQPREVRLGESDGTNVEVTSGLKAGDSVVTGANFLIDSESRLRASLTALTASSAPPAATPPPAPRTASSHGDL
ncbi:efflux RND transporter periplasmic adaptor subunit [Corallococcus sp. H22C18031201]|uniref:efflux RND transporter periplasmic adaptor subunit n=1 Tax=Citreicoccus inhibens TaxID=2849499 RepID=UPI000E7733C3|nr:efflux RND transporter periplasmic adaptor subunit [Citreicoccus inhibens]MBU8900591.1 efflux RND transporter periplasmic adaptor subunit [Citreicoccus inhibens]RJS23307.1 efflux RND transporter periplasmic adaptor subunit [Corallococcus sp. H22C18031201]